jgi:hypothetical protein
MWKVKKSIFQDPYVHFSSLQGNLSCSTCLNVSIVEWIKYVRCALLILIASIQNIRFNTRESRNTYAVAITI